ncbi:glycerophosphodiester phosphodiesterase GDPDL4-like [Canna indica]|uniref:glycerophosphodiester phosphodiesterase n=1 Tax=Canna indica TaxID=4628 RepID=A0AAQ3QB96_9LILI|nr:glycerophosphodiester phosphodiesterase GDPDL4-like [Canna indica]
MVREMGMSRRSSAVAVASSLAALLLLHLGLATAQNSSAWLTLTGNAPAIIARGGFSGLFPDSSYAAYSFVANSSSSDTILWCDVQLSKDGLGICVPDMKLDNCTAISSIYPNGKKTYLVNGVRTSGWFSVDFNSTELGYVPLTQAIYSRSYKFDYMYPILTVDDVATLKPPGLWLNIQHDIFYSQHNLSMTNFVLNVSKHQIVNYVSSPELGFLRGIAPRFTNTKTKLVFRFLDKGIRDPSTKVTYESLLHNFTFIKTFASGILVPKNYIWPVTPDNYLMPYTSIVTEAHKAGLEIYAADFANDNILSYNYSYDPLTEYLNFIDNGFFSVDGVVTDFPITPSEAIGCYSHLNKSSNDHGKPVIISHNGASGDYADCTNLAYQNATNDGADVIDCSVQVTLDGILICMSNPDLIGVTTVTKSPFSSRLSVIRQIKSTPGIYTFNLTWAEIKKLMPVISQPEALYQLIRNPRYKNSGNFTTLADFLAFAKTKPLSGVLINVENAVFMAEKLNFDVVESVISTVNDAGYNKTALEVMIQSTDSSVLKKFKQQTKYKLLYKIANEIGNADPASVMDIKTFADAVALKDESIYPISLLFITGATNLVQEFHAAGLDVYVYLLQNEFVSQPWDFLSDATVQINTYVLEAKVDGIITDFPATGRRYKRNSCAKLSTTPNYMKPVRPGFLLSYMTQDSLPPAQAPMPVLNVSNVTEAPLPSVTTPNAVAPAGQGTATIAPPPPSSGRLQEQSAACLGGTSTCSMVHAPLAAVRCMRLAPLSAARRVRSTAVCINAEKTLFSTGGSGCHRSSRASFPIWVSPHVVLLQSDESRRLTPAAVDFERIKF